MSDVLHQRIDYLRSVLAAEVSRFAHMFSEGSRTVAQLRMVEGGLRECATTARDEQAPVAAGCDIGTSFLAGRIEHLRDQERRDGLAMAQVLGHDSPLVVRMFERADELARCIKTSEAGK